ncbi:MAG: hypothetical protein QMD21_05075 [Candidatus Thermoplasmatota archaeon]|nr:hypothetical protein [Candidatus Thermoplasmatota archaeon]MDI6887339.1 hypothetical protein [Candidatus Thermoplasmatota archaeon]
MALKEILADKTKKRTIAILGTIILILACAGVFWHQAASTPVKTIEEEREEEKLQEQKPEVKEELLCQSDSGTDTATTPGGPGPVLIIYYITEIFIVGNETPRNATVRIEWSRRAADLDLYVVDAENNIIGSSTEGPRTYVEVVELNAADIKGGAEGQWKLWVYYYMGVGPVTYDWSYAYYYYAANVTG